MKPDAKNKNDQFSKLLPNVVTFTLGLLTYFSYSVGSGVYFDIALLVVSIAQFSLLAALAGLLNWVDLKVETRTGFQSLGRLSRVGVQVFSNYLVFWGLLFGATVSPNQLQQVGGLWGIALIAALVSQGFQYVAVLFADSGIGNRQHNVVFALGATIVTAAIAAIGFPTIQKTISFMSVFVAVVLLSVWIAADLNRKMMPQ